MSYAILYRFSRSIAQRNLISSPLISNISIDNYSRRNNISFETVRSNSSSAANGGFYQSLAESTPVATIQETLLNIHDFTGLPWWLTIVASTAALRTAVTFPLSIYQQYIFGKLENLKPEMNSLVEELKKETSLAVRKFHLTENDAKALFKRSCKKQWDKLVVRENCHPFKASLLLWVQIPLWVCLSVSYRNLVYMLPVQDIRAETACLELSFGGFGWIPNLTVADTSLILPIALGVINLAIIELQVLSKVNEPTKLQRYISNFFRFISVAMVPIAATVPSCLCLYWVTSSTCGLLQNVVMFSPRAKRLLGVPKTPNELENPYSHISDRLRKRFSRFSNKNQT